MIESKSFRDCVNRGIIKELGLSSFAVLCAHDSGAKEVEEITRLTGVPKKKVVEILPKLLNAGLLQPSIPLLTEVDTVVQKVEKEPSDIRSVLHYYAEKYQEAFGVEPRLNYGRDGAIVKRVIKQYSPVELKAIVDYGVGQYRRRWATDTYPVPTVGIVFGWLAEKSLALWGVDQKVVEKLQEGADESEALAFLED